VTAPGVVPGIPRDADSEPQSLWHNAIGGVTRSAGAVRFARTRSDAAQ
jgi:hypothetical protein